MVSPDHLKSGQYGGVMNFRTVIVAIAILASAGLVFGQTNPNAPCPASGGYVTCTLGSVAQPLMFGQDPTDQTKTWQTTIRWSNRAATANWIDAMLTDINGNYTVQAKNILAGGNIVPSMCCAQPTISPYGSFRVIFQGVSAAALAVPALMTVQSSLGSDGLPNVMADALVQESDANGNIVESYEVASPTTIATAPALGFFTGLDVVVQNVDTSIIVSNAGTSPADVTVAIYDGTNTATTMDGRTPVTSITLQVAPQSIVSATVGQLLAYNNGQGNADIAAFLSNPNNDIPIGGPPPGFGLLSAFLTATSDQRIMVSFTRTQVNATTGVLTATQGFAFPLIPANSASLTIAAPQGSPAVTSGTFSSSSSWQLTLASTEPGKNFQLMGSANNGPWWAVPLGSTDANGNWSLSGPAGSWASSQGNWQEYVQFADGTRSNVISFTIS
jgi:hypothetical protein